eukprot:gene4625-9185_t
MDKLLLLVSENRYGDAIAILFGMLLNGTELTPNLEEYLTISTEGFVSTLLDSNHHQQANWIWKRTIELVSGRSCQLLYKYSKYLLNTGQLIESASILQHCAELYPHFISSLDSLENIKSLIIDRWHFRMLNDRCRNRSYELALHHALRIHPGGTVLDIGGGSGLLSIYAALAGASHVYCIEMSVSLAHIALQCIRAHGLEKKITVISKYSTDVQIPTDIPAAVDIVVTELVDSGLLGEHIIPVLRDAQRRLLAPGGMVIPHSATVYSLPIESHALRMRQVRLDPVVEVMERELSSRTMKIPTVTDNNMTYLSSHAISSNILQQAGVCFDVDEKYTCEALASFPHTALAETAQVLHLTFLKDSHSDDNDDEMSCNNSSTDFIVNNSGSFDGMAYWFDLHLLPPSSLPSPSPSSTAMNNNDTITTANSHLLHDDGYDIIPPISTAPGRRSSGWDQAVVYSNKIHVTDHRHHRLPLSAQHGRSSSLPSSATGHRHTVCVSPGDVMRMSLKLDLSLDSFDMDLEILDGYSDITTTTIRTETMKEDAVYTFTTSVEKSVCLHENSVPMELELELETTTKTTVTSSEDSSMSVALKLQLPTPRVVQLGEMDMARLNDHHFNQAICTALLHACGGWLPSSIYVATIAVYKHIDKQQQYTLSTTAPNSSLVLTHHVELSSHVTETVILCQSAEQREIVSAIYTHIDNTVDILHGSVIEHYIQGNSALVGCAMKEKKKKDNTNTEDNDTVTVSVSGTTTSTSTVISSPEKKGFDIIVCDVIEGCGLFRQNALSELQFALQFLTDYSTTTADRGIYDDGGGGGMDVGSGTGSGMRPNTSPETVSVTVIPSAISVVLALIECPQLLEQHVVSETATGESHIAGIVNTYGAKLLREIDLEALTDLSRIPLLSLIHTAPDTETESEMVQLSVSSVGTVHALAMWYIIHMEDEKEDVTDGAGSKVDNNNICTGPMSITGHVHGHRRNTASESSSHWRQAAFLIDPERPVLTEEVLEVDVFRDLTFGVWCILRPFSFLASSRLAAFFLSTSIRALSQLDVPLHMRYQLVS